MPETGSKATTSQDTQCSARNTSKNSPTSSHPALNTQLPQMKLPPSHCVSARMHDYRGSDVAEGGAGANGANAALRAEMCENRFVDLSPHAIAAPRERVERVGNGP